VSASEAPCTKWSWLSWLRARGPGKNVDKRTEWCKTFLYADGRTWIRSESISM
jgi:hypothetical protein